jgi:hypothetical protein
VIVVVVLLSLSPGLVEWLRARRRRAAEAVAPASPADVE